jgi:hypothetical protein
MREPLCYCLPYKTAGTTITGWLLCLTVFSLHPPKEGPMKQTSGWNRKNIVFVVIYRERKHESGILTTPAGHVGTRMTRVRMRGRNALRSEFDLLTFCRQTPLTLCVAPMHWKFAFAARTDRIRAHVPIVAQDLAGAAAFGKRSSNNGDGC